jgi:hypothetical protein
VCTTFYVRRNEHPDLDLRFQPIHDPILLVDTVILTGGENGKDEDSSLVSSNAFDARVVPAIAGRAVFARGGALQAK